MDQEFLKLLQDLQAATILGNRSRNERDAKTATNRLNKAIDSLYQLVLQRKPRDDEREKLLTIF